MEIVKIKRRIKTKNANNIKIDNKINNHQVTIIKEKCNEKGCQRKCNCKKRPLIRKRLIKIHRCVPIQSQCDHHCVVPIFAANTSQSFISHPSGTFTITNNSDSCTIKIIIKQKSHHKHFINVEPKSSFTGVFSNLKRIDVVCSSHLPHAVCVGTFELDLLFIAKIN
ncbi:S-Ena type endospore appendage [Paenibacillus endoradicis]|uniref:S-Ena type endospore appendage n=1 Tax=Paenibacillus endoradicis TaxID=2972487 RepID=UPI002158C354|nr:S-Ena type endospore appendage [Paenibacillus endoradicis]MCR8660121.1 hypothetical protein [Paenibacillus endoradicis]